MSPNQHRATHQRIRDIKSHINQLLAELQRIEPHSKPLESLRPFELSLNSSLFVSAHEKYLLNQQCPYVSSTHARFHSTTCDEYKKTYRRKKLLRMSPTKNVFATSTPKSSPNGDTSLKPYLTSTPCRQKRPSTNVIPLKRLLYNQKDVRRPHHSGKRSMRPHYSSLHPADENNLHWI